MVDPILITEKEAYLKKKGWKKEGRQWKNKDTHEFGPGRYCTGDAYRVQLDYDNKKHRRN